MESQVEIGRRQGIVGGFLHVFGDIHIARLVPSGNMEFASATRMFFI